MGPLIGCKKALRAAFLFAFPYSLFQILRYVNKHGRIPNIFLPATYTEKLLCKMMYDRNALLPIISDKLAVRNFVKERLGSEILTDIYAVYDDETELRLDELPDRFVLKANHGSGFNYFVESAADKRADVIAPLAREWLSTNYGRLTGEWAYTTIRPQLFAEEYLDHGGGRPIDYKFFCFDGVPKYLKVYVRSASGDQSRYFDLDWNSCDVAEIYPNFPVDSVPPPSNLGEMIEISRQLSAGFDSLRVDLYSLGNRIVFGELTNYHIGGIARIEPLEYDYQFGSHWNMESMTYLPFRWIRQAKGGNPRGQ